MTEQTDWCAEAEKLRRTYETLRDGDKESAARFGEDEIRFTKANMDLILADLREAERKCAIQQGRRPVRRRGAFGVRIRH